MWSQFISELVSNGSGIWLILLSKWKLFLNHLEYMCGLGLFCKAALWIVAYFSSVSICNYNCRLWREHGCFLLVNWNKSKPRSSAAIFRQMLTISSVAVYGCTILICFWLSVLLDLIVWMLAILTGLFMLGCCQFAKCYKVSSVTETVLVYSLCLLVRQSLVPHHCCEMHKYYRHPIAHCLLDSFQDEHKWRDVNFCWLVEKKCYREPRNKI